MTCGLEPFEFYSGALGGESPLARRSGTVARRDPGRHRTLHRGTIAQPAAKALALEDTQFDLGHVQPIPVLGRVVNLGLVGQPFGFGRRERLIEQHTCLLLRRLFPLLADSPCQALALRPPLSGP